MATALTIDFVSDIACPWCAIGLASLETALARLGPTVPVQLRFQPFELNPKMPAGGQDVTEHLTEKYGSTPEQQAQGRANLRERGAKLGFVFHPQGRSRVYNTFDAHRLLTWAEEEAGGVHQHALKKALLQAYHGAAQDMDSHALLARIAGEVGLSAERAAQILASNEFADETREREAFYTSQGIHAVPSVIINNKHLIQGGQPPEVFELSLRQIATAAA